MKYKPSGNPKVEELIKSITNRSYNLDSLKPIRLEELNEKGKPKKLCAWCANVEIFKSSQKYCSVDCSSSAMASFYPQKEDSLRFLLVRQDWKCLNCQYDYRPTMQAILDKEKAKYPSTPDIALENLHWYYLKRLKRNIPRNKKPEVDHILAISKGGPSLGLDNVRILCFDCHKEKTKKDLSGKRK